MKNIIVTIGEILLGVVLFLLIFGSTGSLRSESNRIFNDTMQQLDQVAPAPTSTP